MFHVWQYTRRRQALFMLTAKRHSRHDPARVPAVWETRSAANQWVRRTGEPERYRVFACEGEACGLGDHDAA